MKIISGIRLEIEEMETIIKGKLSYSNHVKKIDVDINRHNVLSCTIYLKKDNEEIAKQLLAKLSRVGDYNISLRMSAYNKEHAYIEIFHTDLCSIVMGELVKTYYLEGQPDEGLYVFIPQ